MPEFRYGAPPARLEENEPARTETASAWASSLQTVYQANPERIAAVLPIRVPGLAHSNPDYMTESRPPAAGRLKRDD